MTFRKMKKVRCQIGHVALLLHFHQSLLACFINNDLDDGVDFVVKIKNISFFDVCFDINASFWWNVIVENVAGDGNAIDFDGGRDGLGCLFFVIVFVEFVVAGPGETVHRSMYISESGTGITGPKLESVV